MVKRATSKKVPKAMTLLGGIGGPLTAKRVIPALSPGSLQRPYVFVPSKAKKGRKGQR
jgi:hypothetical protein